MSSTLKVGAEEITSEQEDKTIGVNNMNKEINQKNNIQKSSKIK